jgi:exopolysaccharide biosynthesis polyprenyl glycosylphosphotransferase
MFSRYNRLVGALYLGADAALALASFALAYATRLYLISPRPLYLLSNYFGIVPLAIGLWVIGGVLTGIYHDVEDDGLRRVFWDPAKVFALATLILFALTFAFKLEYISRLLLGLYAVIDLAAMIVFRLLARRLANPLRRIFGGYRQFLLVGNSPEAGEIARAIEANDDRGMRIFGFVRLGTLPADAPDQSGLARTYPVYDLAQLPQLLRGHVIDEVIFAVGKDDLQRLEESFLICEEEGVKTRVPLGFFPHVISRVYLERLREMPLLTFTTTPENDYLLLLKRVLDFVMALALLIVLSPLLLVLAIAVKLTSRGPILYRQTRCGLSGRKFTLRKFRSMREEAELEREKLETQNEMDGPVFKIKNDPRRTPLGRLMRRFSLDELPQLANILKGDMSFVGPRPPLPNEVEKYEPWQRRRLRMQPGLTCLWALEGRNNLNFRRWMELDLQYIDTWSPALDLKIILKTIPVVLLGRGAS